MESSFCKTSLSELHFYKPKPGRMAVCHFLSGVSEYPYKMAPGSSQYCKGYVSFKVYIKHKLSHPHGTINQTAIISLLIIKTVSSSGQTTGSCRNILSFGQLFHLYHLLYISSLKQVNLRNKLGFRC